MSDDDGQSRAQRLQEAGLWLIRLQEDALTDREMSDWVTWCERDPENLEAFEQLRALWQAADRLPNDRQPLLRKRIPLWASLAASIVLALVVGAISHATRDRPVSWHASGRELMQTSVAQNQPAILPDGSQLEIGGHSTVAVQYGVLERKLQLRDGEAFFRVQHDAGRPFIVEVGDLQIVAIGTAFNVRRAGPQVAVTVQEGAVEVRSKRGDGPAGPGLADPAAAKTMALDAPVSVHAGQQLVVDSRTGASHQSPIDPTVVLAWRSGRLEFVGDSLGTVVASVNRYAERPITLGDPGLGKLTFTGTVFLESIDAWLDGLQQVFPVTVERSESVAVVRLRPPQAPGEPESAR
ncbi:MAG: FecR domain-containing protein [Steroidobacteraceae bacterium]